MFAIVICLVLLMCTLTLTCIVCINGRMYVCVVNVMLSRISVKPTLSHNIRMILFRKYRYKWCNKN